MGKMGGHGHQFPLCCFAAPLQSKTVGFLCAAAIALLSWGSPVPFAQLKAARQPADW